MSAQIVLLRNPLASDEREVFEVEQGSQIIDWLQDVAPDGFNMPIRVFVNQKEIQLEDLDYELGEHEVCAILICPAEAVTFGYIWATYIVPALISAAVGIALSLLFPPKKPGSYDRGGDPTYDIGATRNRDRLGEPLPVCYGTPRVVIDYASVPYTFHSKQNTNDKYLDSLFCVGYGEFDPISLNDIFVGDTPAGDMPPGTFQFLQFQGPSATAPVKSHTKTWGAITNQAWLDKQFGGAGVNEFPFMEHCHTVPEVTDWEFNSDVTEGSSTKTGSVLFTTSTMRVPSSWGLRSGQMVTVSGTANNNGLVFIASVTADTSSAGPADPDDGQPTYDFDLATAYQPLQPETAAACQITYETRSSNAEAGPYFVCPPNKGVKRVYVDFEAPQGLYRARSSGRLEYLGWGTPDSSFSAPRMRLRLWEESKAITATPDVDKTFGFNHNRQDHVRRTFVVGSKEGVVEGKRYKAIVTAVHKMSDSQKIQNKVMWTGLRSEISHVGESLYNRSTILAVRMKATNGISGQTQNQISVRAKRKFKCADGVVRVSANPIDAAYDIYTDTEHGAGRPPAEVDNSTANSPFSATGIRALWGMAGVDRPELNAVFSGKSTVWDGLESALSLAVARPAIDAGVLTVVTDKLKPTYQFLFNDQNIVKDSFEATYTLDDESDNDSIEVQYRDYDTFNAAFVTHPDKIGTQSTTNPRRVEYFGVTDKTYAQKLATLLWSRRTYQRRSCTFKTEMEGMIPSVGDRVLVSAPATRWGASGRVMRIENPGSATPVFVLDKNLDWSQPFTSIVLTGSDGNPTQGIPIKPGNALNEVILQTSPNVTIDMSYAQEPPAYTTMSYAGAPKNMLVSRITHDGGTVFTVECQEYPYTILDTHPLFTGAPIHLSRDNSGVALS